MSDIKQWFILILLSAALAAILQMLHLPAGLLLGPMIVGVVAAANGWKLQVHKILFVFSQATIGCLVARALSPSILDSFASQWALYLGMVAVTVLASCTLGWAFSRLGIISGTTAVWGLLPGAASAMVIMAEEFGADFRLVAFMQYLRVVCVAAVASLLARFYVHVPSTAAQTVNWWLVSDWSELAKTLAVILLSMLVGPPSRIPGGTLLLPMFIAGFLHLSGSMTVELPHWLLTLAYAFLGWTIGLRFTPDVLNHALKTIPQVLLSIVLLILFSWVLAFALTKTLGTDPLTAYLATSPGGMDSIAIIAANTKVDTPFIMAMQTVRFLLVLFVGPPVSKFVATRLLINDSNKNP